MADRAPRPPVVAALIAMNLLALPPPPVTSLDPGELIDLLLSVARRADELARRLPTGRASDRRLWLRAECEVFERLERARPHAVSRSL